MAHSNLASIVCYWCGRDYAHEYWTAAATFEHPKRLRIPDPRVCFSCRRDTNPDYAADAPRGGPPERSPDVTPYIAVVSPSRKQCRTCRATWDGLIFGSPPEDPAVGPLPFGICPTCSAVEDAHARAFQRPAKYQHAEPAATPELARPARVFGYDD